MTALVGKKIGSGDIQKAKAYYSVLIEVGTVFCIVLLAI